MIKNKITTIIGTIIGNKYAVIMAKAMIEGKPISKNNKRTLSREFIWSLRGSQWKLSLSKKFCKGPSNILFL